PLRRARGFRHQPRLFARRRHAARKRLARRRHVPRGHRSGGVRIRRRQAAYAGDVAQSRREPGRAPGQHRISLGVRAPSGGDRAPDRSGTRASARARSRPALYRLATSTYRNSTAQEFVMAGLDRTFGIAVPNFTAYPQMPDVKTLVEYGVRMERLGFDSLWVWDHILLGVEPNFPIIESLTLLTAIAARTNKIKLGTGILVLPMRNPVILAKQLACMDLLSDGRLLMGMASGWYRREFNAIG